VVRAAGAVLWRRGPTDLEFALVHRPRYDDWSFPKGKLKTGEHVLRAVVREVEEETGCTPLLGRRLPSSYYLKDGRPKKVDYWAATPRTLDPFVPNEEVDQVEWLAFGPAARRLTYEHDVELLREAANGPLKTTPYVVLRHGPAGAKGRADAFALARVFEGLGPLRPISSATARCLETVLPYALHTDVTVTTDRAFTVGTSDPVTATNRMIELLADREPVLVCTHGEIISGLVTGLCARLGAKEPEEPALRKGSFWILHMAEGTLISMERHAAR
jgi:8-oxo-dGTP diphosphatase